MKRILVPCDFSECSSEALKFALDMSEMMPATIDVVYVSFIPAIFISNFSEGMPMGYYERYCQALDEEAHRNFTKLMQELGQKYATPRFFVKYGEVSPTIIDTARDEQADMIIMGSSGESAAMSRFFGTTTQKVVQHSDIPVFVVHKAIDPRFIRNILVPSDLSLDQSGFMMQVKNMQSIFNATLHILLVTTPIDFRTNRFAQQAFNDFVAYYQLENYFTHLYNCETEEGGIAEFAQRGNTDLIMMGTHARKGIAHLLAGSITDEVLTRIQCPIVTYHLKRTPTILTPKQAEDSMIHSF